VDNSLYPGVDALGIWELAEEERADLMLHRECQSGESCRIWHEEY